MAVLKIRDNNGNVTEIPALKGNNGKSPYIKNSTWWTYNDETDQWEDTGVSTSSVVTDSELSNTSANPVQNKVITEKLSVDKNATINSKSLFKNFKTTPENISKLDAPIITFEDSNMCKINGITYTALRGIPPEFYNLNFEEATVEDFNKLLNSLQPNIYYWDFLNNSEDDVDLPQNLNITLVYRYNNEIFTSSIFRVAYYTNRLYIENQKVKSKTFYRVRETCETENGISFKYGYGPLGDNGVHNSTILELITKGTGDKFLSDDGEYKEISTITTDSSLSATSINPIQNKAVTTALDGKVDKVTGKVLSSNDYTTEEKTKLSGIATGAQKNVQADWNATSGDAFIKNKPTIPSVDATLSATSVNPVQNKVITNALDSKVDAVAGKGLSTMDYDTTVGDLIITVIGNETVTQEQYNTIYNYLSSNIEDNKNIPFSKGITGVQLINIIGGVDTNSISIVVVCTIETTFYCYVIEITSDLKVSVATKSNYILAEEGKIGLLAQAENETRSIQETISLLTKGTGNKYLADDGTYKEVATKTSQLTNDSNYVNTTTVDSKISTALTPYSTTEVNDNKYIDKTNGIEVLPKELGPLLVWLALDQIPEVIANKILNYVSEGTKKIYIPAINTSSIIRIEVTTTTIVVSELSPNNSNAITYTYNRETKKTTKNDTNNIKFETSNNGSKFLADNGKYVIPNDNGTNKVLADAL